MFVVIFVSSAFLAVLRVLVLLVALVVLAGGMLAISLPVAACSGTAGNTCFVMACDFPARSSSPAGGSPYHNDFGPGWYAGRFYIEVEKVGAFPAAADVNAACDVFDRRTEAPFGADLVRLDLAPQTSIPVPFPVTVTAYFSTTEQQHFVNAFAQSIRWFAPVVIAVIAITALLGVFRR